MSGRRRIALSLLMLILGGCAHTTSVTRLSALPEVLCKHCNCLMPAGLDPQTTCPVCECGRRTHRCVRGGG